MKRLVLSLLIFVLIITALIITLNRASHQKSVTAMGCKLTITVKDDNPKAPIEAALKRILEIEKLQNRHDEKSEISRYNHGEKVSLSKDNLEALKIANEVKAQTHGAFDVKFTRKIDLDGISKGYAAEEARKVLLQQGVKNAAIDFGSSIAVIGGPFKVGIRNPNKKDSTLGNITLSGGDALSTSGDYEQGSHIIDPKTKSPALAVKSVTIVMDNAAVADALSTGLFVMGPIEGVKLAERLKLKMIMVTSNNQVIVTGEQKTYEYPCP